MQTKSFGRTNFTRTARRLARLLRAFVPVVMMAASPIAIAQDVDVVLECAQPGMAAQSVVIPGVQGKPAIAAGKTADRHAVTDREYILAYKPLGDTCYLSEINTRSDTIASRPIKFWTTSITRSFGDAVGRWGWDGLQLCGYEEIVIDRYTGRAQRYGPLKQYRNAAIDLKLLRGWRGEAGVSPDHEDINYDFGIGDGEGKRDQSVAPNVYGQCQRASRRL